MVTRLHGLLAGYGEGGKRPGSEGQTRVQLRRLNAYPWFLNLPICATK